MARKKGTRYATTQPARKGVISSAEISRDRLAMSLYTTADVVDDFLRDYGGPMLMVSVVVGILLPEYIWPIFLVQLFLIWKLRSLQLDWLLDCPDLEPVSTMQAMRARVSRQLARVVPVSWLIRAGEVKYGDGLLYLGNDKSRWGRVLAASMGRLVTHAKVFGTTGSGKTQWLLGVLDQIIAKGSGAIFVDGKADIVTWFFLYQICRAAGREDDLLVINYLTGGTTQGEPTKHTNTNNLFAYGSSDSLMEMMSALMGEAGGNDGMWRGRAEALGRAVLRALCELRDQGVMTLSVDVIREHITLEAVETLVEDPRISDMARVGLQNYLNELPGWQASQDDGGGQPSQAKQMAKAKASEQHGYLAMQWTSVLELLGATYKAITRTDMSEVDFRDVIMNRRILYIMLPAVEKSPESLKNLGRMAVTAIRNALTTALGGAKLTGEKSILVDGRPTNATAPFVVALDEYGSYCVEGFADVAAQARSLGISTLFMGQDYPSFKKGSEIEAERIEANTGLSIFLKTENAATADLAIRRAGKMFVPVAENVEPYKPGSSRRKYDQRWRIQEVDRITLRDLADQGPGEGRIIFGDELWHVQSFYGDYSPAERVQVNTFVRVHRPTKVGVDQEDATNGCHQAANDRRYTKRTEKKRHPVTKPVKGEQSDRDGDVKSVKDKRALPVARREELAKGAQQAVCRYNGESSPAEAMRIMAEEIEDAGAWIEAGCAAVLALWEPPPATRDDEQADETSSDLFNDPEPEEVRRQRIAHGETLLIAAAKEYLKLAREHALDAWADTGAGKLSVSEEVRSLGLGRPEQVEGGRMGAARPEGIGANELGNKVSALLGMIQKSINQATDNDQEEE